MEEIVLKSKVETQQLIFIFHGYGADKNDLLSVGEEFAKVLENAEIHLANGIEKCSGGFGSQWFPLDGDDIKIWEKAFKENSPKIMSYIHEIMTQKNIGFDNVIFAGFSQGAMLSLSLGLQHGVKAVIAFSGLLLNPELCVNHKNTKVLLTHGAQDDVIPLSAMSLTESVLKNAGINVKAVVSATLSHGIDNYILSRAVDFLKSL